jgi:hypothetical protein
MISLLGQRGAGSPVEADPAGAEGRAAKGWPVSIGPPAEQAASAAALRGRIRRVPDRPPRKSRCPTWVRRLQSAAWGRRTSVRRKNWIALHKDCPSFASDVLPKEPAGPGIERSSLCRRYILSFCHEPEKPLTGNRLLHQIGTGEPDPELGSPSGPTPTSTGRRRARTWTCAASAASRCRFTSPSRRMTCNG